jgi:raffinose/stachyose/melibiose transport system substrate-binding protein
MRQAAGIVGMFAALLLPCHAGWARQSITMWFWGATPYYRQALDEALVKPFNASQSDYELIIEYRPSVDNDVRVALMGGAGPDLVYASGPSDVASLARAGKLAPLDAYARQRGWVERLQAPLLASCMSDGHLYCLPLSQEADGLFYNKAVLNKYGWQVPRTKAEVESIMVQAQAAGLYASVTGNKRWQPVNENYSSIFLNQALGPVNMTCLVSGRTRWDSPRVVQALTDLRSWFQRGFLGNQDYFALDFDLSLLLFKEGRSPFFFAPTILFQWAPKYFTGDEAEVIGFAPVPQFSAASVYPFFDIGAAFTYSINARSKVKEGAAQVLEMMLSPRFITRIAKLWPGYWAPPLKEFPDDPAASSLGRLFYAATAEVSRAVSTGAYGYRVGTFLPPATKDVFIKDVEAMWLDQETPAQLLAKAQRTFSHEQSLGLVRPLSGPVLGPLSGPVSGPTSGTVPGTLGSCPPILAAEGAQ